MPAYIFLVSCRSMQSPSRRVWCCCLHPLPLACCGQQLVISLRVFASLNLNHRLHAIEAIRAFHDGLRRGLPCMFCMHFMSRTQRPYGDTC